MFPSQVCPSLHAFVMHKTGAEVIVAGQAMADATCSPPRPPCAMLVTQEAGSGLERGVSDD